MNLAALFSGGKDSTYAIFAAKKMGHIVKCVATIRPKSDQSHLLHFPDVSYTRLQAESMNIPQIMLESDDDDSRHEISLIADVLHAAKRDYDIEGIVHGGILSEFQKIRFEKACDRVSLPVIAPLWGIDQAQYMRTLLYDNFEFVLTSVTCDGLDDSWLGRVITHEDLDCLETLAAKHSFNLSFEGGEAETFTVNCPLFSQRIAIRDSCKTWDGYRGRFQIREAELVSNAR